MVISTLVPSFPTNVHSIPAFLTLKAGCLIDLLRL